MATMTESLSTRNADSLMSRSVVLIPKEMSIPGAAHLLAQACVSGAPVIGDDGRCIGVISTSDFLRYAEKGGCPVHAKENSFSPWQIMETDDDGDATVEDYMNHDPVTVTPDTAIGDIARMMIDAHIHRVIVVNEMNRPVGIVSSTDILAAVSRADTHW